MHTTGSGVPESPQHTAPSTSLSPTLFPSANPSQAKSILPKPHDENGESFAPITMPHGCTIKVELPMIVERESNELS